MLSSMPKSSGLCAAYHGAHIITILSTDMLLNNADTHKHTLFVSQPLLSLHTTASLTQLYQIRTTVIPATFR